MSLESTSPAAATVETDGYEVSDPGGRRLCWWRYPELLGLGQPTFRNAEEWDQYDEVDDRENLARNLGGWRPAYDCDHWRTSPADLRVRSGAIRHFLGNRLSSVADILIEKVESRTGLGIDDLLRQFDERADRLLREIASDWQLWLHQNCSLDDPDRPLERWTIGMVSGIRNSLVQMLIATYRQLALTSPTAPESIPSLDDSLAYAEQKAQTLGLTKQARAVTMYNWYLAELQAIKGECKTYKTPDMLRNKFPHYAVWRVFDDKDAEDIVKDQAFRPRRSAWALVVHREGLRTVNLRTLERYKKALLCAGLLKPSHRPI